MTVSRRKALFVALGGGGALAGIAAGGLLARLPPANSPPITRTAWALGSPVSIAVRGVPPAQAQRALQAAFAELETVEQVMSLYRPQSELCRLNRTGELRDPHPYLLRVLHVAQETSRRTHGAFDITVQPLWAAFAGAKKQGRLPTDAEVATARSLVDWRRVEVAPTHVRLHGAGRAITLNGLAQGFAADRAAAALAEHGVEHALVNAGEVGARGGRASDEPWMVGIQHPRAADAYVSLVALRGRSLATSGDYETTFTADFRRNHIFDPRTGDSPAELASVSIVAPTALAADALSTAAMILGPSETLRLIAEQPQVEALLVLKNGRTLVTPGFPEKTAPAGSEGAEA